MNNEENKNENLGEEEEKPKKSCCKSKKESGERDCKKNAKAIEEKDKEIEKLKSEIAEKDDRHLRLLAEYDNYRKRTQSEKDAIYSDAVSDTVEKILPVLDNLERSLAASAEDTSPIAEGVRMIEKQFREILGKLGVEEIPASGETFDPDYHNAIMHDEDGEKGENEITEVFLKGYKIGGKVIRHSMVKVVN